MEVTVPRTRPVPPYARKFWHLVVRNRSLSSANFIDRFAAVYEDRPLFFLDQPLSYPFFSGTTVSYRTVARFVSRIGNALLDLGVRQGDRVGLATYNRIELAFAEFGCMKIGAVPVPLNFMLKANEIQYQLENSGAKVLITDAAVFRDNIRDTARVPAVETWVMVPPGERPQGVHDFGEILAGASERLAPVEPSSEDDVALIFYTSGTTGRPKGAMLTAGNVLHAIRTYARISGVLPTNRKQLALLVMPVAHTSGHQNMLIHLAMAIPMFFVGRFDPADILVKIEKHRVTFFAGIPAMFKMLLRAGIDRFDLTSIRVWGGGADAFPRELVRRFRSLGRRRILGLAVKPFFVHGYGMAETAGQICISPPWGPPCAGWVVPGLRYRIVDAAGRPVPRGEAGELEIRGATVMKGYWNDPEKSAEAFRDGWFRTGDILRKGRWGVLEFVDREKDVIKCGGYSIFPTEIEHHLAEHPKIERAVVVGVPHEIKGEMPVAFLQLRPGETLPEEEIRAWADERIAPYKRPRRYLVTDAIPMTFSLKPLRKELRAMAVRRLGDGWERPHAAAGGPL